MPNYQKTRKQRGGAATSLPQSYFAPTSSVPGLPSLSGGQVSTDTTHSMIRPALIRQRGGYKQKRQTRKSQKSQKSQKNRKTQKQGGGFSPTVMGPFLKNVEGLAAPLSIYLGYKMLQTLKGKGKKSSRK
jgi:hypothetical protein